MLSLPSTPPIWTVALAASLVVLSACDSQAPGPAAGGAPQASPEDVEQLLRGTWLREYTERGVRVRRILSLQGDGVFHETARVVDAAGNVTEYRHEGTWLYDGTNLKRRYTLMDGKPPSRLRVPLAAFQISFPTRHEFTGVDHVHGHKVHYRRVDYDRARP